MGYDHWKTTEPDDLYREPELDESGPDLEPDDDPEPDDPENPGVLDSPAWISDNDDEEDDDGHPI